MEERRFIPLSVPNFTGKELEYVTDAIKTEWVSTGGAYISSFEDKIANYVHTVGAVACQSGTAGLHIALHLCGVTAGEEVIVPTLTFIAAVNPVIYLNAEPVFMDCDDSLCINPEKVRMFCEQECVFDGNMLKNKHSGRIVSAIVVVHVFGNMADMEKIMLIAETYHLKVIEDATEALGTYYKEGKYKGRYAGTIGHIGVYSFNGNKIITTGGGGMIVSNDREFLKEARHLTTQAKSDELYYTHDKIGYNYRMTNLQAALGVAQLENLEAFIKIKNRNYIAYKVQIEQIAGLKLLGFRNDIRSNCWFYGLYCENMNSRKLKELIQNMISNQIQVRPIWGLIHEQKPYQGKYGYQIMKAKQYTNHVINLPCSTNLTGADIEHVVKLLKENITI